jgi:hypothetical protein
MTITSTSGYYSFYGLQEYSKGTYQYRAIFSGTAVFAAATSASTGPVVVS